MDLVAASGLILLISFMVALGLEIAPGMLRAELTNKPRLARGLLLDLVLVPLVATVCLWMLGITGIVAAAVVLLSVTPGAPFAPFITRKAQGSVEYVVVLTVILGVVTAFTATPLARWLLSYEGTAVVRPPVVLAKLALLQWLPLFAAAWAARALAPRHVERLRKIAKGGIVVGGVLLLAFSLPRFPRLFEAVGWTGLLAAVVTMEVSVILAWLIGGEDRKLRHSLAATVSLPNIGLAVTIAKAAGAIPDHLALLAGLFLVRFLANQVFVAFLKRATRASREGWTTDRAGSRS